MSFDGSFTHAITIELKHKIKGGRVSKINQPYNNEVIMVIRAHHHNYHLLLSANPAYARAQLTNLPYINPQVPTNFAMNLRKYLNSSTLTNIKQMTNDRVIHFHFITRNELGDLQKIILIMEIMGRHSNIILVNQPDMTIIDAAKEISKNKNRYRQILPGFKYIQPPKQSSIDPYHFNQFSQLKHLVLKYPDYRILAKHLQKLVQGMGRDTAKCLAIWLQHNNEDLKFSFNQFFECFNHPDPVLTQNHHGKISFAAYPFLKHESYRHFPSLSGLLDNYYHHRVERERVREKGTVLIKVTKNELKKNFRKQKKLKKSYYASQHADRYKIKGEILTTFMNRIQTGMNKIKLPNFYHHGQPITIRLSYNRTPSENAQWYFKQYRKKQHAGIYAQQQMKRSKQEVSYFQNIRDQIELADQKDLDDIKYELEKEGYLKDHENNRKNHPHRRKRKISQPQRFQSDDGSLIMVGKNDLQNDHLTFKTADKRDTWLHTQKIHGSHVIIKALHPTAKTLTQAATLAAYFSKGRNSANVPVDYVKAKHVKKPNGAKPGFVIYRGQHTLFVTPNVKLVKHLKANLKASKQ